MQLTTFTINTNSSQQQQAARAAPYLLQQMASPSALLQAQAAWAIGNIAADGVELRDQVLDQGAGFALLNLVRVKLLRIVNNICCVG